MSSAGAQRDEVSVSSMPAARSVDPYLIDLHVIVERGGALTTPEHAGGAPMGAAELAEIVLGAGGQGRDVRVVVPVEPHHLATLTALAALLDRDVLIPQLGACTTGSDSDVTAVDPHSGEPLEWWTVAPSGEVGAQPSWFESVRGRVRPRRGVVALPLPGDGGLMLATREDFVRRRSAADGLLPGHPSLVTVGVNVVDGTFVIGDYNGAVHCCDSAQLAGILAALPLFGADLRMWLSWPGSVAHRRALAAALDELAEVTGATVWAPGEGAQVELRGGCRDLCAVGPSGDPAAWRSHGLVGEARFESDIDGRLVPVGGVAIRSFPGVPLVSLHPGREREVAGEYAARPAVPGAFVVDLAVLADGRLALRYADGSLLAAGARQLGDLLRRTGWHGAPIALASAVSPDRLDGLRRHAAVLAAELGVPITVGHPDDPGAAGRPGNSRTLVSRAPGEINPSDPGGAGRLNAPAERTSRFIGSPRLTATDRSMTAHQIAWLPATVRTNSEAFTVFVECLDEPNVALAEGVPSPNLFLYGHRDRGRLAGRTAAPYVLAVRVSPGGAVDVAASGGVVPQSFRSVVGDDDAYLLPAAWLHRCRVEAALQVTAAREAVAVQEFDEPATVLLRCAGASHGVPGLPAEAARWPRGSVRATVTRFALADEDAGIGGWTHLLRHRPWPVGRQRLLELRVVRRTAIDVKATAGAVAALPSVRSLAAQLHAGGVDVILPPVSCAQTQVLREYHFDTGRWERTPGTQCTPLDEWVPVPV